MNISVVQFFKETGNRLNYYSNIYEKHISSTAGLNVRQNEYRICAWTHNLLKLTVLITS